MPVAELGWSTLAEAVAYFANERYVTTHWDATTTNDLKNKVLNMAYNRIHYCPDYDTPAKADATAAQKIFLIKAQAEMAYYFCLHLADEDRRMGLQSQNVIKAGIVKEDYYAEMLNNLPIPAIVDNLLADFKTEISMAMIDIDRDEDESVDTEVDEF